MRVDREDRFLYLEVCDKFDYHSVAYIAIISGVFIVIVAAIGSFGTFKESRSILLSVHTPNLFALLVKHKTSKPTSHMSLKSVINYDSEHGSYDL